MGWGGRRGWVVWGRGRGRGREEEGGVVWGRVSGPCPPCWRR